jgi:hypothetical protein
MKKGDSLKLDSAWWAKNKPPTLPSTGLGAALKEYEKYRMTAFPAKVKDKDYRQAIAALAALEKVEVARRKGIALCGTVLYYDTKAALQKNAAITKAAKIYTVGLTREVSWIDDAADKLRGYNQAHTRLLADFRAAGSNQTARDTALKELVLNKNRVAEKIETANTTIGFFTKGQAVLKKHAALWAAYTQARSAFNQQLPGARNVVNEVSNMEG